MQEVLVAIPSYIKYNGCNLGPPGRHNELLIPQPRLGFALETVLAHYSRIFLSSNAVFVWGNSLSSHLKVIAALKCIII